MRTPAKPTTSSESASPRRQAGPSAEANNQDLLVWALYQLGGADKYVDVEEVYLECFRLAPARLGWRSHPEIPDYKKCSKALQSVEAATHPALLDKRGQYERRLTAAGRAWCEQWAPTLRGLYGGEQVVQAAAASEQARTLRELRKHPSFETWQRSGSLPAVWADVADAFRCSPTSSDQVWGQRLDDARRFADLAADSEVQEFVALVAAQRDEQRRPG